MTSRQQRIDERASRVAASLKAKCAGGAAAGVLVTLVLAPEALAKLASNHSEALVASG